MNSQGRLLSLSAVKARLKGDKLMLASDAAINEMICEFVLDRAIAGLAKSLQDVMNVADKRIVRPEHLQLALNSIAL